jgi:DNA polymerase-4
MDGFEEGKQFVRSWFDRLTTNGPDWGLLKKFSAKDFCFTLYISHHARDTILFQDDIFPQQVDPHSMILHIDMDAFFASIEERDHPGLRGKPMVVGGHPDKRGVVASANYAARYFGIHSAMPTAQAKRLCPHLIVLPPRHGYYAQISQQVRDIFLRYTPLVEPVSLDAAFLDVTHSRRLFGDAVTIGRRIKREIHAELTLTASVGVAHNKFLARAASDASSPDGFLVIDAADAQDFLDPLPVTQLWGMSKAANRRLQSFGIQTIGELRQQSRERLDEWLGSEAERMWELAHGIDTGAVMPDHNAKSLTHETTFVEDITDAEVLRAALLDLARCVSTRLRCNHSRGRTVQLKLCCSSSRSITRSYTLPQATDAAQELCNIGATLLTKNIADLPRGVRLLSFSVSGFDSNLPQQADLFNESRSAEDARLDTVSDWIQKRFGPAALARAAELARANATEEADTSRCVA